MTERKAGLGLRLSSPRFSKDHVYANKDPRIMEALTAVNYTVDSGGRANATGYRESNSHRTACADRSEDDAGHGGGQEQDGLWVLIPQQGAAFCCTWAPCPGRAAQGTPPQVRPLGPNAHTLARMLTPHALHMPLI